MVILALLVEPEYHTLYHADHKSSTRFLPSDEKRQVTKLLLSQPFVPVNIG